MIAAIVNAVLVLVGSVLGIVCRRWINERISAAITRGLALCVMLIGIMSAIGTENTLCVIICLVVGIIIGEALRIEERVDKLGESLKRRVVKADGGDNARFTEGFVTATLLFCVGSMAIVGSIEAGINHDYSIIFSKSIIDCVSAITFAAAMGFGVAFSALGVLVYQGLITLLAIWVGPYLPTEVITEMSAVGGLLIMGLAFNMLGVMKQGQSIRVANMLPAVFLPILYIPVVNWISEILG